MPKCVTLGLSSPIHKEERWGVEIVHQFQIVEQSDY
jgi:hypothetical protein